MSNSIFNGTTFSFNFSNFLEPVSKEDRESYNEIIQNCEAGENEEYYDNPYRFSTLHKHVGLLRIKTKDGESSSLYDVRHVSKESKELKECPSYACFKVTAEKIESSCSGFLKVNFMDPTLSPSLASKNQHELRRFEFCLLDASDEKHQMELALVYFGLQLAMDMQKEEITVITLSEREGSPYREFGFVTGRTNQMYMPEAHRKALERFQEEEFNRS